jgi:hypothetical protein
MRTITSALLALTTLATLIQAQDVKGAPPANTQSKTATPSVPAGAKRIDAYTWHHTDAKGKEWVYRQTPFGLTKAPKQTKVEELPDSDVPVQVEDKGQKLVFKRINAFGAQTWERAKIELNEDEKRYWDLSKKSGATK